MKAEILKILKKEKDYVSGQELCESLGVSRTAVWKAIRQLEEQGYVIEAVRNKGYRNDEFKAIHIIADTVVLPDMTAYTLLFQNAVLEYSLDSLAHIPAEYIIHVGNLLHGHPYSIGRHGYRSALADSYNSS